VGVQPGLCYRTVLGDLRDHVVGDGEEERGVRVEEAPGDGGVGGFQPEASRVELAEAGGDAVERLGRVVVGGGGGGGVGDADAGVGEGEREEAEKAERDEEEAQHCC